MSEKSDTFKLVNAVELTKGARVGMELTYFDVVALIDDLREENANLTARIAELEERLGLCESALVSMTYQFFYSSESGALAHSFMSAEEEAAEYLVDYGIARWENEHRNSIVFEKELE